MQLTIGGKTARSKFTPATVEVDFAKLPEVTQAFIIEYGAKQYLADGVAGAESQVEFEEGIATRLAKMAAGECGVRTKSERGPTDDPETLAKKLARDAWNVAMKANAPERYKAMNADEKAAAFEKSTFGPAGTKWQTFLDEAVRQIATRKEAAASADDLGI